MTEQYNERDDVREEPRADMADTANTPESIAQEQSQASDEKGKTAGRASGRNDKRETRRTRTTRSGDAASRQPRAPRKRSAKPHAGDEASEPAAGAGSIIQMRRRGQVDNRDIVAESDNDAAIHALEAQGFTADEAIRLVHVSDRAATSGEAREAEATLRRLRFTRWLVERGVLDEFSA